MDEYVFIDVDVMRKREGLIAKENIEDIIVKQTANGLTFIQLIDFSKHVKGHYKLVFKK